MKNKSLKSVDPFPNIRKGEIKKGNKIIQLTEKEFKNIIEKIVSQNNTYDIVYRGQPIKQSDISPRNSIWVTFDIDFAKEYGNINAYKLPKNLNILDTDYYSEWESLIDEFGRGGDYDEYKFEPTDKFINFLKLKGYDGFQNDKNILIFDKSLLITNKELEEENDVGPTMGDQKDPHGYDDSGNENAMGWWGDLGSIASSSSGSDFSSPYDDSSSIIDKSSKMFDLKESLHKNLLKLL